MLDKHRFCAIICHVCLLRAKSIRTFRKWGNLEKGFRQQFPREMRVRALETEKEYKIGRLYSASEHRMKKCIFRKAGEFTIL